MMISFDKNNYYNSTNKELRDGKNRTLEKK